MRVLDLPATTDPALNLAAEEFCVRSLPVDMPLLMVYVNRPAVIIGRHQVPPAEADPGALQAAGIGLFRRLSGGGAVYHEQDNPYIWKENTRVLPEFRPSNVRSRNRTPPS